MARKKAQAAEEPVSEPVVGDVVAEVVVEPERAAEEPEPVPEVDGAAVAKRLIGVVRKLAEAEETVRELQVERGVVALELFEAGWAQPDIAWLLRLSQPRASNVITEARAKRQETAG